MNGLRYGCGEGTICDAYTPMRICGYFFYRLMVLFLSMSCSALLVLLHGWENGRRIYISFERGVAGWMGCGIARLLDWCLILLRFSRHSSNAGELAGRDGDCIVSTDTIRSAYILCLSDRVNLIFLLRTRSA